ncbi:MAG: T9SS type A sorting domain-containing protein [Bacteroidales bacterium]|nr:T9SS type A sorting domain-containing protein [Bacteroidales bacterium]
MDNIIFKKLPCLVYSIGIFIFLVCSTGAHAQNAPITTLATVGNVIPGQVNVPITVTGFNNIGAISLTFDYQYAGLHYVMGTPNPVLGGFAIGDHDLGNGKHRVTMGWFGSGVSLPNGQVIMTVTFTYISGITALQFYDNGASCEYADAAFNVLNDVPQSTYYINGTVCGNIVNPGPVTGNASVCKGQTGVGYSVAPVTNATSYIWTVPSGATIISGNNTNSISVNYSLAAVSGNISVNGVNVCGNGPTSQLPVTVNPLPVANAGPDVTIPYGTNTMLQGASGGPGSFSYQWSPATLLVNPNLQNPQTVNLTVTTVFTLAVTNQATLCKNSDDVVVTISGGPLYANPISVPNLICRGTPAQLFANAGGGSGVYAYNWSCIPPGTPPWSSFQANPVVFPDSTKTYQLSLSDGFNTAQGATVLTVFQLPSATIHGGDTLCGEGKSTILTVDLTGTPPWLFYYSNGITTWLVTNQNTTPYSIVATEPGIYTILAMSDAQCTGTTHGSAVVGVFPIPPTPAISVNGTEIFSTGCCGNQWYRDGILIPGATGQVYQPLKTAHYFDIVTVDGCSSDTSNVIYYLMTGISQKGGGNFTLEPNPASEYMVVRSKTGVPFAGKIRIYAISGKEVLNYSTDQTSGKRDLLIDIRQLSPGMYFLSVMEQSQSAVMKFIVQ